MGKGKIMSYLYFIGLHSEEELHNNLQDKVVCALLDIATRCPICKGKTYLPSGCVLCRFQSDIVAQAALKVTLELL